MNKTVQSSHANSNTVLSQRSTPLLSSLITKFQNSLHLHSLIQPPFCFSHTLSPIIDQTKQTLKHKVTPETQKMEKSLYEERRLKRVEENKKRLEDLNLVHLSQALKNLSPKSSPMKKVWKPRTVEKKMVAVRRSARVAKNPAPVYVEVHLPRLSSPRKSYGVVRGNYGIAADEERASTIEKAEKLVAKLEEEGYPTVIRPMLPSHVTGCFWLGLPSDFCRTNFPNDDATITLVDEEGDEYPIVYLKRKTGLSGGWRGFALSHELVDGDTVVFQVISPTILKVYVIRRSNNEAPDED